MKVDPSRIDFARKYFVADFSGALLTATHPHKILDRLEHGQSLSELALTYLQHQGLFALQQLARNEVTYETFCQIATEEQVKRELAVAEKKQKEEEVRQITMAELEAQWKREHQRQEAKRRQRESDPKYIAKVKLAISRALWAELLYRTVLFWPPDGDSSSHRRRESPARR
jgi:hypothetical protein